MTPLRTTDDSSQQPCIVLLHGVFFDRASWLLQTAELGRGHRVLMVDLPGHGTAQAEGFTVASAADRVLAAMADARCEQAILVGWSLGGFVALEIAATHPYRVAGLVLTGATFEPRRFFNAAARQAMSCASSLPRWVTTTAVLAGVRLLYGPRALRVMRSANPTVPEGLRALAGLPADGFADRLAHYSGPVSIINGRHDAIARPGEAAFMVARPDAQLHVLPHAGHLAPIEAPRAFNRLVLAFIAEVRSDAWRSLIP